MSEIVFVGQFLCIILFPGFSSQLDLDDLIIHFDVSCYL